MFRKVLIAAMALAVVGCTPAEPKFDGVTAVYTRDHRKAGLVLKAAANGDFVIDQQMNGEIHFEGVDYRFFTSFGRKYSATSADIDTVQAEAKAEQERRFKEMTAGKDMQQAQALKPGLNRLPNGTVVRYTPPPVPRFELVERGVEMVGGQRGRLWVLRLIGDPKKRELQVVISTDPALAPVGKLFNRNLGEPGTDKRPDSFDARFAELIGKGTVLRLGELYILERIDRTPLTRESFARPGEALDQAGLRKGPEIRRQAAPPAVELQPAK